jgi:hypothetical protein
VSRGVITKRFLQAAAILVFSSAVLVADSPQRWIHVRVDNIKGVSGGMSINLPIQMASAAIASIPTDDQHHSKFHLQASVNGADLRAVLNAVRSSPDNVFMTIQRRDKEVSVAKEGRNLLIKINDQPTVPRHFDKTISVKVPIDVVRAMSAGNSDDLDIAAGIRVLAHEGDVDFTMHNEKQTVRVWTDTHNSTTE